MKNLTYTDITILLDRSGSMNSIKNDTVGGFNNFIEDQKLVKGRADVTLVQFDDKYEVDYTAKNVKDVPKLNFKPRGNTALLDALGRSIAETGERLCKLNKNSRPNKVVFVVITDGEENASKEYKKSQISEMVKHQQNKYSWDFIFLGANIDSIKDGRSLGFIPNFSVDYKPTKKSVDKTWDLISSKIATYRCSADSNSLAFSEQERQDLSQD